MTAAHTVAATLLAAGNNSTSTKSSAGASVESLLFLVVIFAAGYFLFIRPRSQAARRQRDTLMELSAGDEVLTGAGIFGTVLDVESDRVTLETAPGTRITVLRSTIARRLTEQPADEADTWGEHDEDEAHGAYQAYEHDEDGHDEHGHAADNEDEHGHDEHDAAAEDGHEDAAEHDEDHDEEHDEDHGDDHGDGEAGGAAGGGTADGNGPPPGVSDEAGGASAEGRPS